MRADLSAALDVYVTALTALTWIWILAPYVIYGFGAWALIRLIAQFARAIRLVNDIQQPRKEEQS